MLDALKFVAGAVADPHHSMTLSHYRIEYGRIRAFNGGLALCAPIELELAASPHAETFTRAVAACQDRVAISLTPSGKLTVKSGGFRALIECTAAEWPAVDPEGYRYDVDPAAPLLRALRNASRFVAKESPVEQRYAQGVRLFGEVATATCNIALIQCYTGVHFDQEVTLPHWCVKELLRIGEQPIAVQVAENSVTFHYDGDRWLKTQLLAATWPDVDALFTRLWVPDATPIPDELIGALKTVAPFAASDFVYVTNDTVATSEDGTQGASQTCDGLRGAGAYPIAMLRAVAEVATHVDLGRETAVFSGDGLRGLLGKRRAAP